MPSFPSHVRKVVRSLAELRKAPRGKPVTAAATGNVRKLAGLAKWLRNHLVGADGTCPGHSRILRRPWGQNSFGSYGPPTNGNARAACHRNGLRTGLALDRRHTASSAVCMEYALCAAERDRDRLRYSPASGLNRNRYGLVRAERVKGVSSQALQGVTVHRQHLATVLLQNQ